MSNGDFLTLPGLPGQWQYWCDAEASACWLAPVDDAARSVEPASVKGEVNVLSGFALAPKRLLELNEPKAVEVEDSLF